MLTALFHLISAALIISGLDKMRAPRPATTAMGRAGLPQLPGAVGAVLPGAALGVGECGLGAWALLASGTRSAMAIGVLYGAFALFVLRLRAVDATASCGCFGSADAPPTMRHAVVNISAGAVAVGAAAVGGTPSVTEVVTDGVGQAGPYVALLVIGSVLVLSGPARFGEVRAIRSGSGTAAVRTFTLNESR